MTNESLVLFQNFGYLLISILCVWTVYTVFAPMLEGDKLKRRMNSVASAREGLKQGRLNDLNKSRSLRSENKGFVKELVDKLSLQKILEASDLKDKLAQAGYRGQRPVYIFYMVRLIAPIFFAFFGFTMFLILNVQDWTFNQNIFATVALIAFGYYLPAIFVKNAANKRLKAITPVVPDALDLLLICVESGMSIEMAFAKVSEEMSENSIELAEEFSLTVAELSYLNSRIQAYENFARRNNHVGLRSVTTALIQAERYGTPLGETLRTMADENRQLRVLAAEKKAAALPAKLTVPMIIFFLPVLFIVILTPAGMRIAGALN